MRHSTNFNNSTVATVAKRNVQSTKENSTRLYIEHLFSQYARLLVIRLDLGFRIGSDWRSDLLECRNCFQRLFNNQEHNSLFDHQVGYLWGLEFAESKGWHYHCIFFFDGSKSRQDVTIGNEIGEYWRTVITKGKGTYWNCNRNKDHYDQFKMLGIGMVRYDEGLKRENLLLAANYLCKSDPCLRLVLTEFMKGVRTFGRGEISQNETKMGRQRQGVVEVR